MQPGRRGRWVRPRARDSQPTDLRDVLSRRLQRQNLLLSLRPCLRAGTCEQGHAQGLHRCNLCRVHGLTAADATTAGGVSPTLGDLPLPPSPLALLHGTSMHLARCYQLLLACKNRALPCSPHNQEHCHPRRGRQRAAGFFESRISASTLVPASFFLLKSASRVRAAVFREGRKDECVGERENEYSLCTGSRLNPRIHHESA